MIKNEDVPGFAIYCDSCGVGGPKCADKEDVDREAADKGWVFVNNAKDYCPKCIPRVPTAGRGP